jgi:hypothetical protein
MRHTRRSRRAAMISGADRKVAHSAPVACVPGSSGLPGARGKGGTVNGTRMGKHLLASAGQADTVFWAGEEQFVNH